MKKLIFALSVLLVLSGCSAFRSHTQTINLTCTEPEAVISVNGERFTSPCQVKVKRNRDVSIQAYKEGYVPYQRTVGHHFNETGALDAAGFFLFIVPGIGVFFPGAWSLDETDLTIQLYEK